MKRLATALWAVLGVSAVTAAPTHASEPGPAAPSPSARSLLDGPPLLFVADPRFGMESGVRTLRSLGRLSFLYDEPLRRALFFDETRALAKTAGIVGRLLKLALIDFPLSEFQDVVLHEVYGHGSRAREAGARPHYEFDLPFPYRVLSGRTGSSGYAHETHSGNLDRDIATVGGGIEVEQFALHWLNLEMMQRAGWVHYSDQLMYLMAKTTYLDRLSANLSLPSNDMHKGSWDPDQHFEQLQQRFNIWTDADRARVAARLQTAFWFTFVDPSFWLSAYHLMVTYLFRGERYAPFPRARVAGWDLYASTRYALSPFGSEHTFDAFAAQDGKVVNASFRMGSTGLATNLGLGVRALGFRVHDALSLGGEFDVWYQPEIVFEHPGVFNPSNRVGAAFGAYADLKLFGRVGLTGKLAYKMRGFVMGQPMDSGLYGYVGFSIADSPNGPVVPWP